MKIRIQTEVSQPEKNTAKTEICNIGRTQFRKPHPHLAALLKKKVLVTFCHRQSSGHLQIQIANSPSQRVVAATGKAGGYIREPWGEGVQEDSYILFQNIVSTEPDKAGFRSKRPEC
jgi:hypothetical protein